MFTSPNQRIITVKKNVPADKDHPYTLCVKEVVLEAAKELKGNDFKLFMYFYTNRNNYMSAFSPQDVADNWGMSADTARNCFNNLIDKGFISPSGKNKYIFSDRVVGIKPAMIIEKKFVNSKGEVAWFTYEELLNEVNNNQEIADRFWQGAYEKRNREEN